MVETVIFPLSEDTGRDILAALTRIAVALEAISGKESRGDTATYDNGTLVIDGASIDTSGVIDTNASVDGYGVLTYE